MGFRHQLHKNGLHALGEIIINTSHLNCLFKYVYACCVIIIKVC